MSAIKSAVLAAGISIALATSAFAQAGEGAKTDSSEQWNLETIPEGTGIVMANSKGGKAIRMKIGRKGHAALLASRSAIELPPKTMIYRKDGKLYLVPDRKMPEGYMLFDKTKGWDGD
jgi:hypothetical protein